jgi:Lysine methyltransferase
MIFPAIQVWDGTWPLLKMLQEAGSEDPSLAHSKVVELGSGLGLAGLSCAAALGWHVLLTDVPTVAANLKRTAERNTELASDTTPPPGHAWPGAVRVGRGSVAVMSLDWRESMSSQMVDGGPDPRQAVVIIACEVIWLAELVEAYVRTLSALLHSAPQAVCYMTYTVRGKATSRVFSTRDVVLDTLHRHACTVCTVRGLDAVTSDSEQVLAWKVTPQ